MSTKIKTITRSMVFTILIIGLAACAPGGAAEPTLDPNVIYTAAAQTVAAQLTNEAALNPTATFTPLPPTPTFTLVVEQTAFPTLPLPGTPVFTLAPLPGLATATPNLPTTPDKAQWIENYPPDGAQVVTNARFDIIWTVKNVGTTTWNTKYTVQFFSGKKLAEKTSYNFREETAPNNETRIIVDAVAPSTAGEYFSWWKLQNDQGVNFGDVDITIVVVKPGATDTPTKTPTETP
ncbi:MAG: hypothetical protein HPY76_13940 [Anaerolineae bacterium]|nr:hypothetical protein [Anaerolineae bacterium]